MTNRSPLVRRGLAASLALALGGAALTACDGEGGGAATADAPVGTIDLREVCPAKVVIQTDWNPEAEHGHLYQMLGPNPAIDASAKSVTGPLYASGENTGIQLEIRAGGPAIGFQQVTAQMYQDPAITLGYVDSDQAVQNSKNNPTTGVLAPLDINPQMIMWDPESNPDVKSIADLKTKKVKTLYFQGNAYMDYLLQQGILDRSQVDGSYDGSPSNFVAAGGKDAQQGFATAEPYVYQNEIEAWKKPISYQLVADTGYPIYKSMVAARSGEVEKLAPCLQKLVPVMQQAEVDFMNDPATANQVIVDAVGQYNTGWVYSTGLAEYSVKTMKEKKIVGNGPDATIGDVEPTRMKDMVAKVRKVYEADKVELAPDLSADTIATNRFIDTSIGMK